MKADIREIAEKLNLPMPAHASEITVLLTDSRELEDPAGSLFFAIATRGNDGHRYIADLYRHGVRNFVVTHIPEGMESKEDANFLVVDDVVRALQCIATRSDKFQGYLLAITGSRGKTTLKEWLYQLMEPLGDISRSPRSYNSQIGVPLSMWSLEPDARLGIIEAGISRCGEMRALADTVRPDAVIITNIGTAHSDGFADDAQKACEKALLASGPRTSLVIYCRNYDKIDAAVKRVSPGVRRLTWSFTHPEADIRIKMLLRDNSVILSGEYEGKPFSVEAPVTCDADLENAANALVFMLSQGVDADVIAERFHELRKIGTRLNVSDGVNNCMLIRDSYTSDFSSLRPALNFARRRQPADHGLTLIMSDLRHEAADPMDLYGRLARLLSTSGVSRFIGIGHDLQRCRELFGTGAEFYADVNDFLAHRSASDFDSETIFLKNSPDADFDQIEAMLEARRHETVLEVNLDSIVYNFNRYRRQLPADSRGLVCMVKAAAYGAGSYEVARTLQDCGAAYLAVAVLDEGVELRDKGITMPIMVMNPRVANYKAMFAYNLEPEIYTMAMLEDVIREAGKNGVKNYPVHIKLDTGMHRMGFVGDELPALMDRIAATDAVEVRSVFSHLCTADCLDQDEFTELQLKRYREWSDYIVGRCDHKVLRHVLNTAGLQRYPEHHYDMARLGIGLYGVKPVNEPTSSPLAVVSTLRTVICAIHEWPAGDTVGYGRWGKLTRPSRIATIGIGYADGMNRHFGRGNINVMINGREAPTIGNICMDACMIDVTDIDCKVGDGVEIFGRNMPVERLSDLLDTIPYEILTSVSPRVKRVYYRE